MMDSDIPMNVTLLASDLPSTDKSPPATYASAWAGAHHVSAAATEREERWDRVTFDTLAKMQLSHKGWPWPEGSDKEKPLLWVRQLELFAGLPNETKGARKCLEFYPRHRSSSTEGQYPTADHDQIFCQDKEFAFRNAETFDTLDIDVPNYMRRLLSRFEQLGGRIIREHTQSIANAVETCNAHKASLGAVQGVFVAAGLGSTQLPELKDDDVNTLPIRGQTVIVHAPWLTLQAPSQGPEEANKESHSAGVSWSNAKGERELYLIPRSGGLCVVGGTREPNQRDPLPCQDTADRILARALRLCPALVEPSKRIHRSSALAIEDVQVVQNNVGLRPARQGGPRLCESPQTAKLVGQDVKVVLCYGFGGYGFQNSWGAAFEARDLMTKALGEGAVSPGSLRSLEPEKMSPS
ncbi:unnamed protein product [Jaminaea pallidilutea]